MLSAIKKEIELRKNELPNRTLHSLYFGGGTPSVLPVDDIQELIDIVLKYYDLNKEIEITLEANPDDLSASYLKALSKTPINRLSIGIQSFFDEDLKLMNRAHNASQADASIKRAQDMGLENISIDLIYGAPTSGMEIWKQNVHKAIDLQVPHISSYALTVEPKTALQHWVDTYKIAPPKEQFQNEAFHYLSETLQKHGFIHYEISNFAKAGFHSKHNTAYWQYQPYLGIGPSAHSYNGHLERSWNIANNTHYIKAISENQLPLEREQLSEYDRFNELIMIGLRTVFGVDYSKIKTFPEDITTPFYKKMNEKLELGILELKDERLKIPYEHWFMADGIAADLFVLA